MHFKVVAGLPPMAWALSVTEFGDVQLMHGTSVVVGDSWFAEGAWSDSCDLDGLRNAQVMLGTGGWVGPGEVVVRCASHCLERLWMVSVASKVYVSNSLPFVLAISDSQFDPSYPFYEGDLLSFIRGPRRMRRAIPLANGRKLRQFENGSLHVDSRLHAEFLEYSCKQHFADFEAYRRHVTEIAKSVTANAVDQRRPRVYRPLATVSRGYDSPACAVVAKEVGAKDGLTFSEARGGYRESIDDGRAIGEHLGIQVRAYERDAYRSGDGSAETLFLASGGGGEDVVLYAAKEQIAGRLVFTGFLGDTLWGLETDPAKSEVGTITYPGGGSIGEFRLSKDFVHFPVPIIDLSSHSDIKQISCSAEMASWRLGGVYDRPIPRRIAETAGVPRGSFGTSKMAVTAPMYYELPIDSILGPVAERDYRTFLEKNLPALKAWYPRMRQSWAEFLYWWRLRIDWRLERLPLGIRASVWRTALDLASRGRRRISESSLLVPWAVSALTDNYRKVIGGRG